MFGIGHLLKRVQNRQTREIFVCDAVRNTLKEQIKVDIPLENIKLKDSTISFINIGQVARSEIFIKKHQLLKSINSVQDIITITDFR